MVFLWSSAIAPSAVRHYERAARAAFVALLLLAVALLHHGVRAKAHRALEMPEPPLIFALRRQLPPHPALRRRHSVRL